jgi:hypothetical protein
VPLREVTEDFVQAKVLQFFQRLSGGGTPLPVVS